MPEVRMVWRGPIANFFTDLTALIDLEGALNCGKTTGCLWKIHDYCLKFPGIWTFMGRYTDGDTQSKLVPAWNTVCRQAGEIPHWNSKEECYEWANTSRTYCFGLKAADTRAGRYAKLRGLGVSVIYVDQGEELPPDFFPELVQRLRQPGPYPHQLIISPNPLAENSWLAKEFPDDNSREGRKYYSLSLYDNAHNLPPETVRRNELAYPPAHAKHRTMILGRRGLNVIGEPVYAGAFERSRHEREIVWNPQLPLYESIDFGKHNPCWIFGQFYMGGMTPLAGIMGQDVYLKDFVRIGQQKRAEWFPHPVDVLTCCDPAGSHESSQGLRDNAVQILRQAGLRPIWRSNSNAPDVRYAMVERIASYMRSRTPFGEGFTIQKDPKYWIQVSPKGETPWKFLVDGLEAGYVWDDHLVSVGSKQVRKPKKDGRYEHGQNCLEYLELNFGSLAITKAQEEERGKRARSQSEMAAGLLRPSEFGTAWMS